MNNVTLKTVYDLRGMKFYIPSYQRGYKWTVTQVNDLLSDLDEFISQKENQKDQFYCLQPLVVKNRVPENSSSITYNDIKDLNTYEQVLNKLDISWEVIDGQQRLTTIYLLLNYLDAANQENWRYEITYETRQSDQILSNLDELEKQHDDNADYFHMYVVYKGIQQWFEDKDDQYKTNLKETILHKTQFIWYECKEDDAKAIFTRLNIGKIGLTNSELIKAILLKDDNFADYGTEAETHKLRIAMEWDEMEQRLQDDEFWMFFADVNYSNPTRIDYLFDIVYKQFEKLLENYDTSVDEAIKNKQNKEQDRQRFIKYLGTDKYSTFRLFDMLLSKDLNGLYAHIGINKDLRTEACWKKIRSVYHTLLEWYRDLYFYHYVGFLIEVGEDIVTLLDEWGNRNKDDFKEYLKQSIRYLLAASKKQKSSTTILDQQYEIEVDLQNKGKKGIIPKTQCRPILLLHNIQSVINQNIVKTNEDEFDNAVFYRFPFHLFRKHNGKKSTWDVEHIDSNEHNSLEDNYTRLLWLLQYQGNESINYETSQYANLLNHIKNQLTQKNAFTEDEIKKNIKEIKFETMADELNIDFDSVASQIEETLSNNSNEQLTQDQKNQIWNFTLLDSHTNRSYGNSIFPAKRRTIAAKDRRMVLKLSIDNNKFKFTEEYVVDEIMDSFIPPITRNVFMKYYTPETTDFSTWSKMDAEAYKNDMSNLLYEFLNEKQ